MIVRTCVILSEFLLRVKHPFTTTPPPAWRGKVGKDSTDKLECDYVVDDVSGEIFYQIGPKAK